MIRRFDHITIVVEDEEEAKRFFAAFERTFLSLSRASSSPGIWEFQVSKLATLRSWQRT